MSIQQNFPTISPSLSLNFARSKTLDPRITFSRTNPTATRMNEQGLIETVGSDIPRFDHEYENGVIKSLGLLVEEQRSNLITYSDTLTTGWSHIGFTSNAVDSSYPNPTGNLGTKKLVEETGNTSNQKVLYEDVTVGNNDQVFSHSIFVKPIGDRNAQINIHNGAPSGGKGFTVNFNLSGLTTFTTSASASSSLVDYGVIAYPNGWYRIYVVGNTGSLNSDGTTLRFHLRILDSTGNSNYTGDGSSGLYAYGAQMELGSFPTSYIPRPDTSTATRSPDNVSMVGENFSSWYNQSEGTIVSSWKMPTIPSSTVSMISSFSDGTTNNRFMHYKSEFGANNLVRTSANGTAVNNGFGDIIFNALSKTAFSYETGTTITSYNGSPANVVSQSVPTSVNALYIGGNPSGITDGSVTFSQLTYYPRRLTNSQLQNLTK